MSMVKTYLATLFAEQQITIPANRRHIADAFADDEQICNMVTSILENQGLIMKKWELYSRISAVKEQPVMIPNGTAGKPYTAVLDPEKLQWDDLIITAVTGFEAIGLQYDAASGCISGIPAQSGDIRLIIHFRIAGQDDAEPDHTKQISLVINPDPKTLWKEIDSDRTAPFWKDDNVVLAAEAGDKQIVIASKRGRSHANTGSFRDDDFAFRHFEDTGWSVIAVADGAGSARLSREGSRLAGQTIIDYCSVHLPLENFTAFDALVTAHHNGSSSDTQKQLNHFLYNNLGKAALSVYKKLEETAALHHTAIKDFHTTLIFALIKKYDFGYAVLSFGVGDCPMVILNKDLTEVHLMNKLDVGEYGGGTRFITMQEIFQQDNFANRFGFQLVQDFSYLILMTDGIYDPKFAVEANLEKPEKWQEFLADLKGDNEQHAAVDFTPGNPSIAAQLAGWMDFWSPGNHDDRTLAIVF